MAKKQKIINKENPIQETEKQNPVIRSLAGSLTEAFSEDFTEIADEDIIVCEIKEKPKKYSGKKAFYFMAGVLTILFAFVGLVTTIRGVIDFTQSIADNRALKTEFALFVYPAVATDIPTFDEIENLPQTTVIKAAIAKIMLLNDTSSYKSDVSTIFIPAYDIENTAKSLFGYGCVVEHQSVGLLDNRYEYNAETKTYSIPSNARIANYSPEITEISNVGDLYTLTVAYYPPSTVIEGMDIERKAGKVMTYVVSKTGDMKSIVSITFHSSTSAGNS